MTANSQLKSPTGSPRKVCNVRRNRPHGLLLVAGSRLEARPRNRRADPQMQRVQVVEGGGRLFPARSSVPPMPQGTVARQSQAQGRQADCAGAVECLTVP